MAKLGDSTSQDVMMYQLLKISSNIEIKLYHTGEFMEIGKLYHSLLFGFVLFEMGV